MLGPLGILLDWRVLAVVGFAIWSGYLFHKGRVYERNIQAAVVIKLNNGISEWRDKFEASEREADDRLREAMANLNTIVLNEGSKHRCEITEEMAQRILDIAGD